MSPYHIEPNSLLLALRTARHLRPSQVYGRLLYYAYRPRVNMAPAPPLRLPGRRWHPCPRPPAMLAPHRFRFLSIERDVTRPADWNRADVPKLWLYHLHYFDDLVADGALARRPWHERLIQRWMDENPPTRGIGWEPYPTSLRIVNWIQYALCANQLSQAVLHSLAVQARWLEKRMEFHLLGNHLWSNAKALVFAGAFFNGREADELLNRGLAILRKQLVEQILPDGGHFERSPMYHSVVLTDLIDLIQLAETYSGVFQELDVFAWRAAAGKMLRWLRIMTHPDGGIAFFNDAALDAAPDYATLSRHASSFGVIEPIACGSTTTGLHPLPESGYVRLERGQAVVIADVGEIGPLYQPGHAHADTLSFELSLHGSRVIVNGGTSTYEVGPERIQQRGTASHNTVVVNEKDSSEVWASFRVARRARPRSVCWWSDNNSLCLDAAHDGYRRLKRGAIHVRRKRHTGNSLAG